jgi:hypothetical protein
MKFIERIFRAKERLASEEEREIRGVLAKLVFGEADKKNISKMPSLKEENTEAIGGIILDSYYHFAMLTLKKKINELRRNSDPSEIHKYSKMEEWCDEIIKELEDYISNFDKRDEEYINILFGKIKKYFDDFTLAYFELAFTPLISEKTAGYNCLGFTQVIGKILQKAGFHIKMAISVNHPMCLVEVDDKILFISNYGIDKLPKKIFDGLEINGDKPIYVDLSKLDLSSIVGKSFMEERIFVVTNFEQGVLYEYFETLESIKAIEKGELSMTIPGNVDVHTDIIAIIGEDVLRHDYQKTQRLILPEIRKIFDINHLQLLQEFSINYERYEKNFFVKKLAEIIAEYLLGLYDKEKDKIIGLDKDSFLMSEKDKLRAAFLQYYDDVANFFLEEIPFPPHVPQFLISYVTYINQAINSIEIERLRHGIAFTFMDMVEKKDEVKEGRKD